MLLPATLYAQWIPDKLLTSPQLLENDSNRWAFSIDMTGFFKNNEYFSPLENGYTLPGINLLPKIQYQVNNRFRAQLGTYSVFYSGEQREDGIHFINDIFVQMEYVVKPDFYLVFGNIYGGLNHRLIEPLYQWEKQFTSRPESGLQLLYQDKQYFADVWINWQRYIERGDSVPEVLTFGTSASLQLTHLESSINLSIPFQLLINHHGGQIDTSDEKMIVLGNAVTGIHSEWSFKKSFIQSIAFDTYLAGYYDKLPDPTLRPYDKGWGVYPVLQVKSSLFTLMTGYWYAEHFYAFDGEPLLGSFNPYEPGNQVPIRKMITAKLAYSQQLLESLSIGAQIETYTDLVLKSTDYSFGVYIRFNKEFNLKSK